MEDNMRKRVYIYVYGWVIMLYSKNWLNIVNQLHVKKKILKHIVF